MGRPAVQGRAYGAEASFKGSEVWAPAVEVLYNGDRMGL